ncbi:MAG: acyl carrier protein [Myxococcales bacterium]
MSLNSIAVAPTPRDGHPSWEPELREMVARIAEVPATFAADVDMREELNMDSIRSVELMFEIEQRFTLLVPEERYAQARSFEDLLSLIRSLKQDT